jgi:chromate transporter
LSEATRTWARIGVLSFGGPAGQIAVMHRILVDEKRWLSEQRFLHALSYCMLLPGPEAQQLATYIGWLMHGTRGGLVAGLLFVLPGFVAIMALSFVYVIWQQHSWLAGSLLGLKAAVIALVIEALARIAGRALRTMAARLVALAAFVAIALLHLPFPAIVLGAGLLGYLLGRSGSMAFSPRTGSLPAQPIEPGCAQPFQAAPTAGRAWRLLALWLPLWFAPVLLAALLAGTTHVFTGLGVFFAKMAVVSFGGAYAVLSYVAQQGVERFGWITPGQMLDGLGLAESTPGPLILVVQFVGFLAAFQAGGEWPLLAGFIGALITVWVTFVPCFLWIFLGAPYVERLRGNHALSSALNAITAAVVGVIANLALWFTTHVLFERVSATGLPDFTSLQAIPAVLTAVALLLVFTRRGLGFLLLGCTALGAASTLLPVAPY